MSAAAVPPPVAWPATRVLVTGAAGFIGAHLARALVEAGADLACLVAPDDDAPVSPIWTRHVRPHVRVLEGRLEDLDAVRAALDGADTVFHLGARTLVGPARHDPLATFEANVRGTWHVLEACRERSDAVRRVVVASSDKAYGSTLALPYAESTPLAGRFPYDVSKSCADLIAQSYATTWGLPVAVARCGNVFGPGDLNWSRIVPGTLRALLAGARPVVRSDGTPRRDYVAVEDAVSAYLALAARVETASPGDDRGFNFGPGRPLSVLEMIARLRAVTGRGDLEPVVRATAVAEIPEQSLDATRAARDLGWAPRRTLAAALEETVAWYREHLGAAAHARATGTGGAP